MAGPLSDIRIVEIAAIGPMPLAALLLASMGAEIIRLTPPDAGGTPSPPPAMLRGRTTIHLDLKQPEGRDLALSLFDVSDALLEGFRPGVMERLGLGPDVCHGRNQRLVYARMTGWGQAGPLAERAGHDINYIALSGALHAIGAGQPVPPLNLVGDYGGGAMFLLFGLLCAIHEAGRSGRGQVIDCAMADGAAMLMTTFYARLASGDWRDARMSNRIDGGAPYYGTYETADGKHVAVGAVEDRFWRELLHLLDIPEGSLPPREDPQNWALLRDALAKAFRTRPRDEWAERAGSVDACVTPVLSLTEAPHHPHNVARQSFERFGNAWLPAMAPRLARTTEELSAGRTLAGNDAASLLRAWGVPSTLAAQAQASGALR
jgi:alpha-methylacyl-CoA racemase